MATIIKIVQIDDNHCRVEFEDSTEGWTTLREGKRVAEALGVPYVVHMGRRGHLSTKDLLKINSDDSDPMEAITKKISSMVGSGEKECDSEPKSKPEPVPVKDYVLLKDGKYYIMKGGKKLSTSKDNAIRYAKDNNLEIKDGGGNTISAGPSESEEVISETKADTTAKVREKEGTDNPKPNESDSECHDESSIRLSLKSEKNAVCDSSKPIVTADKTEKELSGVPEMPLENPMKLDLAPAPEYKEREQEAPFIILDLPLAGEDAPPVAYGEGDYGCLIVCDGMGGAGGQHVWYNREVRTMAFASSRCSIESAEKFIRDNISRFISDDVGIVCEELGKTIAAALDLCAKENSMVFKSAGTLARFLPTTLAACVFKVSGDCAEVASIWAGDSRIYCVMPDSGLHPLTTDDSRGNPDDMASIFQDAPMSNTVSIESPFHINYRRYTIPLPCMLFASSDGVSQYADSPMHLEKVLLPAPGTTIAQSMLNHLNTHPFDDRTFAAVILDENEEAFSKKMYHRASFIESLTKKVDALNLKLKESKAEYVAANRAWKENPSEEAKAARERLLKSSTDCQKEVQEKITEIWESSYKKEYYGTLTPQSEGITRDIVSEYATEHPKKTLAEIIKNMDNADKGKQSETTPPAPVTEPETVKTEKPDPTIEVKPEEINPVSPVLKEIPEISKESADIVRPNHDALLELAKLLSASDHFRDYIIKSKPVVSDVVSIKLSKKGINYIAYIKPQNEYDLRRRTLGLCPESCTCFDDRYFAVIYKTAQEMPKRESFEGVLYSLLDVTKQIEKLHNRGIVHCNINSQSIRTIKDGKKKDTKLFNHCLAFEYRVATPDDVPQEALLQKTAYDMYCLGEYILDLIGAKNGRGWSTLKEIAEKMVSEDPASRPNASDILPQLRNLIRENK